MTPELKQKRKEYTKRYYEKNKETILAKGKESPAAKAARKRYREKPETKEKQRQYRLINIYGITVEEYEELLISQNYKCAGCATHQAELTKTLNVDHDHDTGEVRGLLCGNCNRALGLVKDNTKTLLNLITYLEKYNA